MAICVLVVDDHSVVRQRLRMFVALDIELDIVGKATNEAKALHGKVQQRLPNVVLMDLLMPVIGGITAHFRFDGVEKKYG